MTKQEQIKDAAQCLLGINDLSEEWGYFEIEQFLDWVLDNPEELEGVGYPMEVMTREYEVDILNEIEKQIRKTNPKLVV
jgi:hypothetical protein